MYTIKMATEDYPFTSWKTYFAAFVEYTSTEFYGEKYPKYEEQHLNHENEVDIITVNNLLNNGLDSQEGLDGFISAMLAGSRYSCQLLEDPFPVIVKKFIEKGAVLNIDTLVTATYTNSIEDEMCCGGGNVKAGILCSLVNKNIIDKSYLDSLLNWENVTPCYWEDIDTTKYDARTQFLMAIKHDYARYENPYEFC